MKLDHSVPGFATVSDWDPHPSLPLRLLKCEQWRDCGIYGSCTLEIEDAGGHRYYFFFERILGRLCHGSNFESGDDAAFIKRGSELETSLFAFLHTQCDHLGFGELLASRLRIAETYTEVSR